MLLHAFYLFIELLTVKKMSCICHLTPINAKRNKYMVVAQILKNHLSFLKKISNE